MTQIGLLTLAVAIALAAACAPASSGPGAGPTGEPQGRAATKRITSAMLGEPKNLLARMKPGGVTVLGGAELEKLVNVGLAELTPAGQLQPVLAEQVPSPENGLWQVLPDGRMETTWRIRPNAAWHDGTRFTADDLIFTALIDQDRELPITRPLAYAYVEGMDAPDSQTLIVRWKQPYIDADALFANVPLPKHLLEEAYTSSRDRFSILSYWGQEFVGTGPYTVKQFVPGSSMVLAANDRYVLGRPKIDEIEVRFILDVNALLANFLSGTVELHLGRGLTAEHGLLLESQGAPGSVAYQASNLVMIFPQFIDPSPTVLADVRFRRALLYGTDREQLADSLEFGRSSVSHLLLSPEEPEYRDVEGGVLRYEYDPRRAVGLIEGLGYTRGSDGMFRDSANQQLAVEVRSSFDKIVQMTIVPVADMWTRLGVSTEPLILPTQLTNDREYLSTFPSFRAIRQPANANRMTLWLSSNTPLPENRFVGQNYSRYMSPELDALIDRYQTTIPRAERMRALGDAVRYFTEHLNYLGLFYDPGVTFVGRQLRNVEAGVPASVHLWDTGI